MRSVMRKPPTTFVEDHAFFFEVLKNLFDEERISLSFAIDDFDEGGWWSLARIQGAEEGSNGLFR